MHSPGPAAAVQLARQAADWPAAGALVCVLVLLDGCAFASVDGAAAAAASEVPARAGSGSGTGFVASAASRRADMRTEQAERLVERGGCRRTSDERGDQVPSESEQVPVTNVARADDRAALRLETHRLVAEERHRPQRPAGRDERVAGRRQRPHAVDT